MGKLMNRVALVTGAGTGLGRAIAIAFANEGATVVLTGRREGKLREVEREIGNGKAIVIPADLTDETAVRALRDELLSSTNGKLDILVNNAGGVSAMNSISELTLEQWKQMMDLNLTSQFLATKAFLPTLRKSENGKILSITSGMANFYMNGFGAYSSSKAGVEALMKTVAAEEKENGIQVNLFVPINVISEGNLNGEKDPAEIVAAIIELATANSIEKSGEVVKP